MPVVPAPAQKSPLTSHAGAEFFCRRLQQLDPGVAGPGRRILIAGCGAGHEAALIQLLLGCHVEAVDVVDDWRDELCDRSGLNFRIASVCDLPYEDGHFDAVFYHHVIEHVDDSPQSLAELSRVLKPAGWIFIGTPNRHRLVSSVGAHRQIHWEPTWRNKLNDNLNDWSARLRRRFRNEYGAHAGFSQSELSRMLAPHFADQRWVTRPYLNYKYLNHRLAPLVSLMAVPPLCNFSAPSIYVFAAKAP